MSGLDILANEHNLFEKLLYSINCNLTKNATPEGINKSKISELLDFFSNFWKNVHLEKEENILFPLFEEKGLDKANVPLSILLEGHRRMTELINESISYLESDNIEAFSISIKDLLELVKAHGTLEYIIFFPIVQNNFTSNERTKLETELQRFFETKNNVYSYATSITRAENLINLLCKKRYKDQGANIQKFVNEYFIEETTE